MANIHNKTGSNLVTWGWSSDKIFFVPKIIQFFTKINDIALVPGHLNQWFWHRFWLKIGAVLGCFMGFWRAKNAQIRPLLFLELKKLQNKSGLSFPYWPLYTPEMPKTNQILSQIWVKFDSKFWVLQGSRVAKMENTETFIIKTLLRGPKEALFLHFGSSTLRKQPKTIQILRC